MILAWWRKRQRYMDRFLLWPVCRDQCETLEEARMIFRFHMEIDPAYRGLSEAEKNALVEELD